jgi:hypothetical protein
MPPVSCCRELGASLGHEVVVAVLLGAVWQVAAIALAEQLGLRTFRLGLGHCHCYNDAHDEECSTCCDHPFLRLCEPFTLVAVGGDGEAVHRVAVVAEVLSAIARAPRTFRLHVCIYLTCSIDLNWIIFLLSSAPIPGYQKHPPELVRWLDRTSLASKHQVEQQRVSNEL